MSATNYETEALGTMVERFLDDGVIDSDEIIELVQFAMEAVEKKTELSGAEKKKTAMAILKSFMESRVNNWLELEKLISKAIDFGTDVSKNGISKVVISSITVTDTKSAFNLIYSSTMSKINEKYPLADDIINNLFDITQYILELIEGQTQMKENEKKILLKKILNHIVVLYNVFGPEVATRLLFFKVPKDDYITLKTYLIFLSIMPDRVKGIRGNDIISSNISVNAEIASVLRKF